MKYAPIALFVYNRPWHTQKTLESLFKNPEAKQSKLYIFSDGIKENASENDIKKIKEVRRICHLKKWCKDVHVVESKVNMGLAESILGGVTKIVNKYGKIIVLEDDLILSPGFLRYMNDALTLYQNEDKVMHVSGYMFPVKEKLPRTFFYNTASCWGWGTWKRSWRKINTDPILLKNRIDNLSLKNKMDLDGYAPFYCQLESNYNKTIKTWAIKWYSSIILNNGYCLHPYPSLVNNIGHDDSGENCGTNNIFYWKKLANKIKVEKINITASPNALISMQNFYSNIITKNRFTKYTNILKTIISKIKNLENSIFLKRISFIPRWEEASVNIFGKKFIINDSAAFVSSYKEIVNGNIYKFVTSNTKPLIVDCGANTGLSIIMLKKYYPESEIIGFEADPNIYKILKSNIRNFELKNVTLKNSAVWNKNGSIEFYSDGADGGSINNLSGNVKPKEVKTINLKDYLNKQVDFLKLDIEGAETNVLEECKDKLNNVNNIFIEYHQYYGKGQTLHSILKILNDAGFHYSIMQHGVVSQNPLIEKLNNQGGIEMLLNIFGTRA